MAWSSAALTAAETANAAADKPLIALQVIPKSPTTAIWSQTLTTAGTDKTDSGYPILRAYDGYPDVDTRTDGTLDDVWYLVLDLGALTYFDCMFLMNTNFNTATVDASYVKIADDSAFTTNVQTIFTKASYTAAEQKRHGVLDLNHGGDPQRYYAQYVALQVETAGNWTPQVGEWILGRRRQLEYIPNTPFDNNMLHTEMETTRSMSGKKHSVIYSRGEFVLDGSLLLDDSTAISDYEAIYANDRAQFVWVYEPNSAPDDFHLMCFDEPDLTHPIIAANVREAGIRASEQGPEEFYLSRA